MSIGSENRRSDLVIDSVIGKFAWTRYKRERKIELVTCYRAKALLHLGLGTMSGVRTEGDQRLAGWDYHPSRKSR